MKLLTLTKIFDSLFSSIVSLIKPTHFATVMSVVVLVLFSVYVSYDCAKYADARQSTECKQGMVKMIADLKEVLDD